MAAYSDRHFPHMGSVPMYSFEERIKSIVKIFITRAATEPSHFTELGIGHSAFLALKILCILAYQLSLSTWANIQKTGQQAVNRKAS
ncbi:hypothetical protein D3C81_1825090 [compost metagenome]